MTNVPRRLPFLHSRPHSRALRTGIELLLFTLTALLAVLPSATFGATFTENTFIGYTNQTYDGQPIIITNCTVTIDGVHSFENVRILAGGVLTHSPIVDGIIGTNTVSVAGETNVVSFTNAAVVATPNVLPATVVVTDTSGSNIYVPDVDYSLSISNEFTLISMLAGSSIPDNSTVLVSYTAVVSYIPAGLNLAVTNGVEVDASGTINVAGKGYGPAQGPGAGHTSLTNFPYSHYAGSGGGHGGFGGNSSTRATGGLAYESTITPLTAGSGGGAGSGPGGAGGGRVNITIGGTFRVDGAINASGYNGTNASSGGGAGGAIRLIAQSLTGTGSITASGGAGELINGGGGGGGRIALYAATNAFSGALNARGGAGFAYGGAGTIYQNNQDSNAAPQLLVDNGGSAGTNTLVNDAGGCDVTVQGGAALQSASDLALNRLTIKSNSWFNWAATQTAQIHVANDAFIESSGGLKADGKGLLPGVGGGQSLLASNVYTGGGGSYAGIGGMSTYGAKPGPSYGTQETPTTLGSSGGNGTPVNTGAGLGGGAVRLLVDGTLVLNGRISADGLSGTSSGSGGGSGGSVWITAGTLAGQGSISANGGNGELPLGGGGGGGRVAIYYGTNLFAGKVAAHGGLGGTRGGAGTIYWQGPSDITPQLVVDNAGFSSLSNTMILLRSTPYDLTISGGASVFHNTSGTLGNLFIGSNSWCIGAPQDTTILRVTNNAVIEKGGGFLLDGAGSPATTGSGPGKSLVVLTNITVGSGGGHGGFGGNLPGSNVFGGIVYGNPLTPTTRGSGGGNGSGQSPYNLGGAGGGALQLIVSNVLTLNGVITANGLRGIGQNSGGGSGGSVYIIANRIAGSGSISANGGAGDLLYGGGGGGGHIAVYYNFSTFTGRVTAYGGVGAGCGGAGTIFLQDQGQAAPVIQFTVDNGGNPGTNTPLPSLSLYSLTITGGAVAIAPASASPLPIRTLLIGSNSWLLSSNSETLTINITNGTIQTGGGIRADGLAYKTSAGAGRMGSGALGVTGGGGGFGGAGGASLYSAGGSENGQITVQYAMGSPGGGSNPTLNSYTAGGGGVFINAGQLTIDGLISANGSAGPGYAGGGSGGSLSLAIGKLYGSGLLAVNGGAGGLPYGGGGGGGRIVLTYGTNQFSGKFSAAGGAGYVAGAAGTIYLKANQAQFSQVTLDNGGLPSISSTPITYNGVSEPIDLAVQGGAKGAVYLSSLRNLIVATNSSLILSNSTTVTSNVTVQAGGEINMNGLGNLSGSGPGTGHVITGSFGVTSSGGGYGGYGGNSYFGASGGKTYGSLTAPLEAGSGGGMIFNTRSNLGGSGGGTVRLTVNGTLTINGRVSADGSAGLDIGSGGGSGGAVNLTAGILAGAGTISAVGGDGESLYGGGGGGGRIAIAATTNLFTGAISARGGAGAMVGGAGTIYLATTRTKAAQVIVDNGGQTGTNTPVGTTSPVDLTISGGGRMTPYSYSGFYNILITSNSWLWYSNAALPLYVSTNMTVQRGGRVSVSGAGYPANSGPGTGGYSSDPANGNSASGAGHGGYGAPSIAGLREGGKAYGSLLQPTTFGSGGGGPTPNFSGGAGGGALQITVAKTLQLDGIITANGQDFVSAGAGGGAGGSLWLTVGKIAGTGTLSADGGDGDYGQGGGGGGGRIAIYYSTNEFQGAVHAWGGLGSIYGGAGTVYTEGSRASAGKLVVDNGGFPGTNTPVASSNLFELIVSGSAVVNPDSGPLLVSSLRVDSGGMLTHLPTQTNIDIAVLTNAVITGDAAIGVSGLGYTGAYGGPGAGQTSNSISGGGGYGGPGGAGFNGAPGGIAYGSPSQPTDRGSRGGLVPSAASYCQGGGAVRMQVGGTLTIDGFISANGNPALIEGGGGGAGGSIWLTARRITGSGLLVADGGTGEPGEGGGGGGGRIAVYALSNDFTGLIAADGGDGASPGGNGTIYLASSIPLPQVIAQSPSGIVESNVSYVDLTFGSPMDFSTASGSDFQLDTPNGPLAPGALSPQKLNLTTVRVSFPSQSELGYYVFGAGPDILDIYGQPMPVQYFGNFAIVPPLISGRVVDTNGVGVPYLTIQVSSNAFPILTDANGNYSLEVFPNWTGTITPDRGGRVFIPASRSFVNVGSDLTNQNFMMTTTSSLAMTSQIQGTNMALAWYGLNGVSYQVLSSTNLVDWVPYGLPVLGTNGPSGKVVPVLVNSPENFFRFRAGY